MSKNKKIAETETKIHHIENANPDRPVDARLDEFKVLILNADGQPLSYFPLSTERWDQVMWWLVKGEQVNREIINVMNTHKDAHGNDVLVRTGGGRAFPLPSVVMHKTFIPMSKKVAFTRFNLYLRDNFTCQWSGEKCLPSELTFEHIIPKSVGGKTTWNNIVAAKRSINERRGNTPRAEWTAKSGYKLLREPYEPSPYELYQKGRSYPPKFLHESWQDWLYWDAILDEN